MIKKLVLYLMTLACLLNPLIIYADHGAAVGAGVGAGLFGLGLGLAIGSSRNKEPQVIYVQQPTAQGVPQQDVEETDDETDYDNDDEDDDDDTDDQDTDEYEYEYDYEDDVDNDKDTKVIEVVYE